MHSTVLRQPEKYLPQVQNLAALTVYRYSLPKLPKLPKFKCVCIQTLAVCVCLNFACVQTSAVPLFELALPKFASNFMLPI